MARVPTYRADQVAPVEASGARFQASTGPTPWAAVGEGLQQIGQVQEELNLQFDEEQSRRLALDYQRRRSTLVAEYQLLEGDAALTRRPEIERQLSELSEEMIGSTTNRRMRRMATDRISPYLAQDQTVVATHAIKQQRVLADTNDLGQQELSAEAAAASYDDPALLDKHLQTSLSALSRRLERKGFGPDSDVAKVETLKTESGIHRSVIERMLVEPDGGIDLAAAYLDAHADRMTEKDERSIRGLLQGPLARRSIVTGVDELMGAASADDDAGTTTTYADPLRGAGRAPVPGGRFGAPRDYGSHKASDLPAAEGTPIYSRKTGIVRRSSSANGGNIATIEYDDGTKSRYMHLSRYSDLKDGDRVTPDSIVGYVGSTGRSSGPHLHWEEIGADGKHVDPSTVASQIQQGPKRHDLNALLAAVDKRTDLSPEQKDDWKREVERRVGRDESLLARENSQSARDALKVIIGLGDGFTSMSQIPGNIRDGLDEDTTLGLMSRAESNREAKERAQSIRSDEVVKRDLQIMAVKNPEAFKNADLAKFVDKLSSSDLTSFAVTQAKMQAETPDEVNMRGEIMATVNLRGAGMKLTPEDEVSLYEVMRTELHGMTGGKRPNEAQMDEAWRRATKSVVVQKDTTFLGVSTGRSQRSISRFQLQADDIPPNIIPRIDRGLKERGLEPTPENRASEYRRFKGVFW